MGGAQQTDFVIVLRDIKSVNVFRGKGQIKFGADASIAAGVLGRNAQVGVGANEQGQYAAILSYSQSKGPYVGVALESQGIAVRNECNQAFYGKKIEIKDILTKKTEDKKLGEDYDKIISLLTGYAKQKAVITADDAKTE